MGVTSAVSGGEIDVGVELGLGFLHVMNGGIEYEHGARMRPGDVITSGHTKLASYNERETRLGLTIFTTTETTWTNQNGEMVRISRGNLIRY